MRRRGPISNEPQAMTLREVERRLGCKREIVSRALAAHIAGSPSTSVLPGRTNIAGAAR